MKKAIPNKYAPLLRFQRRWPALADLENNPLFLFWLYKKKRRKLLDELAFMIPGKHLMAIYLIGAIIIPIFHPIGLNLSLLIGIVLIIAILIIAKVFTHKYLRKDRIRSAAPLYGAKSEAILHGISQTPIDHKEAILGLIAPRFSPYSFKIRTLCLFLLFALDCGALFLFSFPLIHYYLHAAVFIILFYCHGKYLDAFSLHNIRRSFQHKLQYINPYQELEACRPLAYDAELWFLLAYLTVPIFVVVMIAAIRMGSFGFFGSIVQVAATVYFIAIAPLFSVLGAIHQRHAEENLNVAVENSRLLLQTVPKEEVIDLQSDDIVLAE